MLAYPPFRELLIFNVLFMAVIGSLGVFTVEYLREESRFDVATVLYLSAFSFIGALVVLPIVGGVVDKVGSKPLMRVATGIFHWNRHSIYFLALLVLNAIAFAYIRRLHESPGAGSFEPSLIYARLKRSPRFWHR